MSRSQLERRVDELAETYSGDAFAEAVRRYAETLDEDDREELKAVLLERAQLLEDAVGERFKARGWLGRMLDRIEDLERRRLPPGNQPDR